MGKDMFPNLVAEMARKGIKKMDLTEKVFNGATNKTWRKLNVGKQNVELTLKECETIRDTFFPDQTLDYLFKR